MAHKMTRRGFVVSAAACAAGVATAARDGSPEPLRAGACAIDITPKKFPVIVNGMFTERKADRAHDPLHARCLVLAAGATRVAVAVVDNCLMPRELLDEDMFDHPWWRKTAGYRLYMSLPKDSWAYDNTTVDYGDAVADSLHLVQVV